MPVGVILIVAGVFLFIFFFGLWAAGQESDARAVRRLEERWRREALLRQHYLTLPEPFKPPCEACGGRGGRRVRRGSMVHSTSWEPCSCRRKSAWIRSLAEKWMDEETGKKFAADLFALADEWDR